ncbi:MAG: hypothetical protein HY262_08475 [Chloroflexi bacterium]|nr:hypothetical protein [Chloroflexota bacterium]
MRRTTRPSRVKLVALLAGVILAASVPATASAHNDGYLGSWQWPTDYLGTYRFDSSFSIGWMRSAVSRAVTTIGHQDSRNADFELTTASSANGVVSLRSNGTNCGGPGNTGWGACAQYSPANLTWTVWYATQWCWTDGTSTSCTDTPRYDVETVGLNELGHIATLAHHLPTTSHDAQGPTTYGESVVQSVPDQASHVPFGVRRSLGLADTGALHARYGTDPSGCYPPPCASSPQP